MAYGYGDQIKDYPVLVFEAATHVSSLIAASVSLAMGPSQPHEGRVW